MNKTKSILKHTLELLANDVRSFRNLVLASENGELPKEIKEKEKLVREIQLWLKSSSKQATL
jgi:hypothetical protein